MFMPGSSSASYWFVFSTKMFTGPDAFQATLSGEAPEQAFHDMIPSVAFWGSIIWLERDSPVTEAPPILGTGAEPTKRSPEKIRRAPKTISATAAPVLRAGL